MDAYPETAVNPQSIVELVPVLIAITNGSLRVLTVAKGELLPNGLLAPLRHSLQAGVRMWVAKQTSQPMGYVEQLYTFVDTSRQNEQGLPVLYVSYLGLVREAADNILHPDARWQDCYCYFPWEDLRSVGRQHETIVSRLRIWANSADTEEMRQKRLKRIHLCWGVEPENWSEEYVLQRYEMLYESGLIAEAAEPQANFDFALTGQPMRHDHRRVLATALSRLRAKIKYRPVIFELMPPDSRCCNCKTASKPSVADCCISKTSAARFSSKTSSSRRIPAYQAVKAVLLSFTASATMSYPIS